MGPGGLFQNLVPADGPPLTVRAARAARCRVVVQCLECDSAWELHLGAFAANRLAGTPLAELPLRCRCGSRAFRVTVSGGPLGCQSVPVRPRAIGAGVSLAGVSLMMGA